MIGIGTAAVAGFGTAVKASMDFEKELSRFKAVTGATEQDLEKVRKKALQLGADTQFSAGEAAAAIVELGKAGVGTEEILGGVADAALNLAAAGELELAPAAELLVSTMAQFNLKTEDSARVANVLAGAANASTAEVGELGESMKYAGPVAAALGLSIEDTAAALAVFHQNGIKGSMAGTALRSILGNLQPTTKRAGNAMMELGLITKDGANVFFDAQGKIKPMDQVIGLLTGAFERLSPAEASAAAEAIFGERSMAAIISTVRGGPELFNQFADAIERTEAADIAADKMDNLAGSWEQFKGSVETALIVAGAPAQEPLRAILGILTSLVNAFASLPGPVQAFIAAATGLGGIGLIMGGGFLLFLSKVPVIIEGFKALQGLMVAMKGMSVIGPIISGVGTAVSGVGAALGFLLSPVGLVIAAIALLVGGFVLLYMKSETFRNFINGLGRAIADFAKGVVGWFADLPSNLAALWDGIKNIFSGAWEAIKGIVRGAIEGVRAAIQGPLDFLSTYFAGVWRAWEVIVEAVWNTIKGVIGGALEIIQSIVSFAIAMLTGNWGAAWSAITGIVEGALDIVKAIISGALNLIIGIVGGYIQFVIGMWRALWDGVKVAASAAWQFLQTVWDGILNGVKAAWTAIVNAVKSAIDAVVTFIKEFPGKVVAFIRNAWDTLRRLTVEVWTSIGRAVRDGISRVIEFVRELPGKILGFLRDLPNKFFQIGRDIIDGLVRGIKNFASRVWQEVKDIAQKAKDAIVKVFRPGSPARATIELGISFVQGLIVGMQKLVPKLQAIVGRLAGISTGGLADAAAPMRPVGAGGGVSMGGIVVNINAPNGDPHAIATEVKGVLEDYSRRLTDVARGGSR